MKILLVSAGLVASGMAGSLMQVTPVSAAEPQFCEGSAVYCEQFAFNCTTNNGVFTNLDPMAQRIVSYSCELPADSSADLFASNIAGTYVAHLHDSDPSDDSSSDNDNGGGSNNDGGSDNGGGDDNGSGSGGGNDNGGGSGGDDGNGNIL